MDLLLKDKTAIVCGGSSGLGFAVAEALAKEGCNLILVARQAKRLSEAAKTLVESYKVKAETHPCDLGDKEQRNLFSQKIINENLKIDILINNTGGPPPSLAATTSENSWTTGFTQLFLSTTQLTQTVLPGMRERKFGRIITITSLSSIEPIEHLCVSSSMRAAVSAFSKTLAHEVAKDGITVNAVMPGVIHTARIENLRSERAKREGTSTAEEMDKTARDLPMRRLGNPTELGALVAFLASPLASYISGANIPVDGAARRTWF